MRKLLFRTALLALLALVSCKGNIYREFHNFDNYTWSRFDKVTFTFTVDDEGVQGDIILSLRYLEQIPYDEVPLSIILTSPSGEERIIEKTITIRDKDKKLLGDVAGSYWDIEEVIFPGFFFNKAGEYRVEAENLIPRPQLAGVVDLGLVVERK